MSWLKGSIADYAKDALTQAQRSIDRALEIEPGQDPILAETSRLTSKPRTPPTRRKERSSGNAASAAAVGTSGGEADSSWSSWGASTMNTFWESSFSADQTSTPTTSTTKQEGKRPKSNAMKLGGAGGRKVSPTKLRPTKAPASLPVPSEPEPLPSEHEVREDVPVSIPAVETAAEVPAATNVANIEHVEEKVEEEFYEIHKETDETEEHTISSPDDLTSENPAVEELRCDSAVSDLPLTLTNLITPDECNLSDPLTTTTAPTQIESAQLMARSSSSNASSGALSTMTLCAEGETRDLPDHISEETGSPDKDGWSDLECAGSEEDEGDNRCQSIGSGPGSTASSSVLMLHSPYDTTTESSKSEQSEPVRTPTNSGDSTSGSVTQPPLGITHQVRAFHVSHQFISFRKCRLVIHVYTGCPIYSECRLASCHAKTVIVL
eukprot:sb/3464822/